MKIDTDVFGKVIEEFDELNDSAAPASDEWKRSVGIKIEDSLSGFVMNKVNELRLEIGFLKDVNTKLEETIEELEKPWYIKLIARIPKFTIKIKRR